MPLNSAPFFIGLYECVSSPKKTQIPNFTEKAQSDYSGNYSQPLLSTEDNQARILLVFLGCC